MTHAVLEWAPFRVKPGVTEKQLLAASAGLQSGFLSKQAGFLERRLVRRPDGSYVDVVLWASAEAAARAMKHAEESETCSTFFSLMESDSATAGAGVEHFDVIAGYSV